MIMTRSYKLGLYEKAIPGELPWQSKFSIARDAGFDYIEISIDESESRMSRLDWKSSRIHQLTQIGYFEGMRIGSICLSCHRRFPLGGEDIKKALDIMQKAINFAVEGGIPIIQLAGYDVYYSKSTDKTKDRFELNLQKALEMAAEAGILLGFETMETPFMDTVEKTLKYINRMRSPYLGVYPDIGNLNNSALLYGTDINCDLEKGKGHLLAIHVKETVPGKYREVTFGTGMVDFQKILAKTWELGVRRYVTELWYTGNADWKQKVEASANLVREILDTHDNLNCNKPN